MKIHILLAGMVILLSFTSIKAQSEDYLKWDLKQAEKVGKSNRTSGRTNNAAPFYRVMTRERAKYYQLRVTLFTPDVIRASARFQQLNNRLTNDQTKALVAQAEAVGDLVALVEVDPAEGSGVVPVDWRIFLQPGGFVVGNEGAVAGIKAPELRQMKLFSGVTRRDYEYDAFWVIFPLVDGNKKPFFGESVNTIEVSIGIESSEGKLSWTITPDLRARIRELSK